MTEFKKWMQSNWGWMSAVVGLVLYTGYLFANIEKDVSLNTEFRTEHEETYNDLENRCIILETNYQNIDKKLDRIIRNQKKRNE